MDALLPAIPFQGDALATIIDFLPIIVLIIVLVGVMMWSLAWLSRYVQYLKTLESAWLDRATIDFVHRVLESVVIAFVALMILALAATRSPALRDVVAALVERVPALFVFVFVMFAAAIIVRVFHRFAAYLRGELKAKPRRVAPPTALAFAEVVLKYIIYLAALVIGVLGSVRTLPLADQDAIRRSVGSLPEFNPTILVEVLLGILLIVIADRFVGSIFEDLKGRTKKFTLRAVEEFKSVARYSVWVVGAVVLFFIVLNVLVSETGLVVFAAGFIAFVIIVAAVGFETARSLLAGLALMRADLFDVGDRIRVGDESVCDVVAMGLTLTTVRTLRGELVQIPNSRLLQEPVMNFSRSKPYAIFVEVAIGFDIGHERVRDVLLQAARETEGIVQDRPPEVFGKDVSGDKVVYQLYAYTDHPERMKEIKSNLIYRIQDLFGKAGIRP